MMPRASRTSLIAAIVLAGCTAPRQARDVGAPTDITSTQIARSRSGMVVSGSAIASTVGARILEQGGNAVDAAVATAFALSVVEPSMSGIGGRTQLLIRTPNGEYFGIDGGTAIPRTFVRGSVAASDSSYGYRTVGVPGTVAALAAAQERHGTMALARVMAPAIALARDGFRLPQDEAERIADDSARLARFTGSRGHFLKGDGSTYRAGERFRQSDLATTLQLIADRGPRAFYSGAVARRMADDVRANGGWLSVEDLESYVPDESRVVKGSYRGHELVGTYLPASGVTTIEAMHILENFELAGASPAQWVGLVHQSLLLAFEDREKEFGSEAQKAATLVSKAHARARARAVRTPGSGDEPFSSAWTPAYEPEHTTHLSATDARGGVVSLTQSVGPNLGSRVSTPGLGFLYAATMGYLGDVQPGDRPFSSQSPLIVTENGEVRYVLGAAGARRIISALVAVLSRSIDQRLDFATALAAPRLHSLPARIDLERRAATSWTSGDSAALAAAGFTVRMRSDAIYFARIHGIHWDRATREFVGVADPRWQGTAAAPR